MEEFNYTDWDNYIKEIKDSSDERLNILAQDLQDRSQVIFAELGRRRMCRPAVPVDLNGPGMFDMGLNGLVD